MGKASFLVYFMHVFRVLLTNISASKILLVIITCFQMYVHTPWLVLGTKNEEEEEFCVVKVGTTSVNPTLIRSTTTTCGQKCAEKTSFFDKINEYDCCFLEYFSDVQF